MFESIRCIHIYLHKVQFDILRTIQVTFCHTFISNHTFISQHQIESKFKYIYQNVRFTVHKIFTKVINFGRRNVILYLTFNLELINKLLINT